MRLIMLIGPEGFDVDFDELEDIELRATNSPKPTPDDVHHHKCADCGNIWSHQRDPNWEDEQITAAHTCGACGGLAVSDWKGFKICDEHGHFY